MCDQQQVLWGRLLKILKEIVYESKAFGLYFTDIKESAENSKLTELQKGIQKGELYVNYSSRNLTLKRKKENDEVEEWTLETSNSEVFGDLGSLIRNSQRNQILMH